MEKLIRAHFGSKGGESSQSAGGEAERPWAAKPTPPSKDHLVPIKLEDDDKVKREKLAAQLTPVRDRAQEFARRR